MAPTVKTSKGELRGVEEGALRVFRGIPFARPPVGELRFRAPEDAAPWPGVRDATRFASRAMQVPNEALEALLGRPEDQPSTRRRLPLPQRLDARPRRRAPARDGLDSRRRLHHRLRLRPHLRRQRPRLSRRRSGDDQLQTRPPRLPLCARPVRRPGRALHQLRHARPGSRVKVGPIWRSRRSAATRATSPSSASPPER